MNIGDKIESELLDGTKIKYTLDNIDTNSLVLIDGTKITCKLDNIDTDNTILLNGTKCIMIVCLYTEYKN